MKVGTIEARLSELKRSKVQVPEANSAVFLLYRSHIEAKGAFLSAEDISAPCAEEEETSDSADAADDAAEDAGVAPSDSKRPRAELEGT